MTKVLGLDSDSAITVFSSVVIPHESKGEISEADLENYLSKVVWKSFDVLRNEAAERLGVSEVDLILAGVRVVGIKVDGHEVLNPHGFSGKTIEISLSITMVKRGVLNINPNKQEELPEVLELSSAESYLLSKSLAASHLLYLDIKDEITKVFLVTPTRTSYLNEFNWGLKDVISAYTEEFGVLHETAREIYEKFVAQDISPIATEKMKKVFQSSFKKFTDGLTLSLRNLSGLGLKKLPPVYLKSSFSLPQEINGKALALGKKRGKLHILEQEINISDLVNNPPYNVYDWLNQLAKRRIKWLMP
ncbi:MAG: hypothetical protein A3E61_02090 [Candidatus Colwellbacteria bacterium RIFCSPHIGHO2_12_FULL_43_12]|uniref:Uncharacterized protein n=3 Tax=Candidatus Colwelliibacteriota TaxID=1817904 RepID=A0A1G1YYD6_9BACT|nr:MAG: hypothetical protein A3D47_00905 [Candidatus Colwellbacteria bacterium RIFCSPHIGHO2_02_FULL_43_15]OGY59013.1 MAG: hypothetical protein A3E61_02090 [Candidatus Colwellbacteria bacterium RIFCSPHIGHO2_12_FULL_43_12]OGY60752.1 MAG: hypothetical protein A3F99_01935 [Candidatus Colwellbacteria bacterium RIFCSPLOWO2_12_FULL_43_11]